MSSVWMRRLLARASRLAGARGPNVSAVRPATTSRSGSILPMPQVTRFGLVGIVCAVVPGLLIGATISKRMASFLEENELFVPSDDDDDDD